MIYDPAGGEPVEIAPGRGDLRFSSVPFDSWMGGRTSISLVDGRPISYARLFADQNWVATAVLRLLSWSVRVPLKVYERTGDDSRRRLGPKDHPIAGSIVDPWEQGTAAALTMSLLGPLCVHGNGTNGVENGAGDVIRWVPADWRNMEPIKAGHRVGGWTLRENGKERTVPASEMVHAAWWSPFGPVGISPLQQLGVTLSIEQAAQRYQQSLFRNGARPPSAITADREFLGIRPEERQVLLRQLREDVTAIYSGPENAGRPAILPPGLDWQQTGHTAVEAELIDQRRITREEVAAVYQIPPPLLGIYDRATFSNIETAREIGYTDGLAPPLVLIEQAITATLVHGLLREHDIFVEFDFAGVLRGDRLKEIQALREAISTGLLTPNEGRGVLNYPRSDENGMDAHYLPMNNLKPVGEDRALGEVSLAAQRLGLAFKNGVVSQEEAREMIGVGGDPPPLPDGSGASGSAD